MEWLNYHHLLYFWMVAREGGLAPAGKVLRLSQSALSGQIKRLEDALGVKLLERRGRGLAMTETGRVVYQYADEIFGLGRELLDAARGRQAGRRPRLRVGIADAVPKLLVRTLLAPALAAAPATRLTCHEDRLDRLLVDLAAHHHDVVIADAPVPPDAPVRAFSHLLGESTVTLLATAALAGKLRRGFPRSLDGAPLVAPTSGVALRRELDAWLADAGVAPDIVAEADDSALLKAFASEGMGAVCTPTVIAAQVAARERLVEVGVLPGLRERYYALSAERKLVHPAVVAIRASARSELFG